MKLSLNEKENEAKITIQNYDDLFNLYLILEEGDELYSWTLRQKKIYKREGKAERGERERVYLGIKVKKVRFDKSSNSLKVLGELIYKPEDFEASGHHSFKLSLGDTVKIKKEDWSSEIIKEILEKSKETYPKSLIVSIEYGSIAIAELSEESFKILYSKEESIGGKQMENDREGNLSRFIEECSRIIKEYFSKIDPKVVILYGPSNIKDRIFENLKDYIENIHRVSGSIGGLEGIYEAIRNEEALKILSKEGEDSLFSFDSLLKEPEKIAIGMKEIEEAALYRAIGMLIISTKFLKNASEEDIEKLRSIAKLVKKFGGSIKIINEETDFGKTLSSFGDVIAKLRFSLK